MEVVVGILDVFGGGIEFNAFGNLKCGRRIKIYAILLVIVFQTKFTSLIS